jgi:hypothetical protein
MSTYVSQMFRMNIILEQQNYMINRNLAMYNTFSDWNLFCDFDIMATYQKTASYLNCN